MKFSSRRITSFFINFWNKSSNFSQLSFLQKFLFYILCFFEKLYCFGFFIILFIKKHKKKPIFPFKVFSVGNLSVGGTGKSVFVQFLIKKITSFNGAIVLRGYKGACEKLNKSFLVSDGNDLFCTSSFCGDEAFMLSNLVKVSIVVGKNRASSCLLLKEYCEQEKKNIDYVVLDDGYQNFDVKKDFDILLIDARRPFYNGHCLPAGRLREKDYLRANAIILTHADLVEQSDLDLIKNNLLKNFNKSLIFTGKHKTSSLLLLGKKQIDLECIKGKRFLVFAGIGSFSSFLANLNECGLNIVKTIQYSDHYKYCKQDLIKIINFLKDNVIDVIITTHKDWVKILPLLKEFDNWNAFPFYILSVEFEFLSKKEEEVFLQLTEKLLI